MGGREVWCGHLVELVHEHASGGVLLLRDPESSQYLRQHASAVHLA